MYNPLVKHSVGIDQKNLSKILFLESLMFANKVSSDSFKQNMTGGIYIIKSFCCLFILLN
jgi:hypothetical protein